MDPKPSYTDTIQPIPTAQPHDLTPSSRSANPIPAGTHPLSTPPGLRDVPGAESNARPFDPRPVGSNESQ
ncbi:MAG: hypothetical protein WCE63_04990 [Acidobacteriaceae bacterium]